MMVRARSASRWSPTQDRLAQGLEHRVMRMTQHHEIVVSVGAAIFTGTDVMDVEDGGALPAKEAAATEAIAREDARPGVFPCSGH